MDLRKLIAILLSFWCIIVFAQQQEVSGVIIYTFRYDGKDLVGLIAEDVENVMPELVSYNKEGDPETVYYSKLVN